MPRSWMSAQDPAEEMKELDAPQVRSTCPDSPRAASSSQAHPVCFPVSQMGKQIQRKQGPGEAQTAVFLQDSSKPILRDLHLLSSVGLRFRKATSPKTTWGEEPAQFSSGRGASTRELCLLWILTPNCQGSPSLFITS